MTGSVGQSACQPIPWVPFSPPASWLLLQPCSQLFSQAAIQPVSHEASKPDCAGQQIRLLIHSSAEDHQSPRSQPAGYPAVEPANQSAGQLHV